MFEKRPEDDCQLVQRFLKETCKTTEVSIQQTPLTAVKEKLARSTSYESKRRQP